MFVDLNSGDVFYEHPFNDSLYTLCAISLWTSLQLHGVLVANHNQLSQLLTQLNKVNKNKNKLNHN